MAKYGYPLACGSFLSVVGDWLGLGKGFGQVPRWLWPPPAPKCELRNSHLAVFGYILTVRAIFN